MHNVHLPLSVSVRCQILFFPGLILNFYIIHSPWFYEKKIAILKFCCLRRRRVVNIIVYDKKSWEEGEGGTEGGNGVRGWEGRKGVEGGRKEEGGREGGRKREGESWGGRNSKVEGVMKLDKF